jgi:hypothetical protein
LPAAACSRPGDSVSWPLAGRTQRFPGFRRGWSTSERPARIGRQTVSGLPTGVATVLDEPDELVNGVVIWDVEAVLPRQGDDGPG